jgi:hypothetical protein
MVEVSGTPIIVQAKKGGWGDSQPAGPADLHQRIVHEHGSGANLPCADAAFLLAIQRSAEYQVVQHLVTDERPSDTWQEDGFHFFVFPLLPEDAGKGVQPEIPMAVFTMHPESQTPISAVLVAPSPGGAQAEVVDLRQPGQSYTAPLPT